MTPHQKKKERLKRRQEAKFARARLKIFPAPGEPGWGVVDTNVKTHDVWMGNEDGPLVYKDEFFAKLVARMICGMLRWKPLRCRPKPYTGDANKLKDVHKVHVAAECVLEDLESGRII